MRGRKPLNYKVSSLLLDEEMDKWFEYIKKTTGQPPDLSFFVEKKERDDDEGNEEEKK